MNRKGVELSLQTIVIIVLMLLVLGVLLFFLLSGATLFNKGTGCQNCIPKDQPCNGIITALKCNSENEKCCLPYDTNK